RVRLGLLALRARWVKDWRPLEDVTAAGWLRQLGGDKVFEGVWGPLLRGKFGEDASEGSAVWFWNKLKLRGGSRGEAGGSQVAYFEGGSAALADEMAGTIESAGGRLLTRKPVSALLVDEGRVVGIRADGEDHLADATIATPALPIIANLVRPHASAH